MASALEHGIEVVSRLLEQAGVVHEIVPHVPTFRARDAAAAGRADAHYTAKTLVLHDRGGLRVAVIPADCRLDLDKTRRLLGATKHLRLATEDEIRKAFPQFECGALPPIGLPLPEVIDVQLIFLRGILCAGGDHRHSVRLDPRELVRLAEPRVGDVSAVEDPPRSASPRPAETARAARSSLSSTPRCAASSTSCLALLALARGPQEQPAEQHDRDDRALDHHDRARRALVVGGRDAPVRPRPRA